MWLVGLTDGLLLINVTTCSNATEVAQWRAPSCSQPQPATDNGVRAMVPTELHVMHDAYSGYKSQNLLHRVRHEHANFLMPVPPLNAAQAL